MVISGRISLMNTKQTKLTLQTSYVTLVAFSLREHRETSGIPQASMAKGLGISPSALSRIEKGETALTSEQLALAGKTLEIEPSAILQRADAVAQILCDEEWTINATRMKKDEVDLLSLGLITGLSLPNPSSMSKLLPVIGAALGSVLATRSITIGALAVSGPVAWVTGAIGLGGAAAMAYKKSRTSKESVFDTALTGVKFLLHSANTPPP